MALFLAKDCGFIKRTWPRFGEIIKFSNRSIQKFLWVFANWSIEKISKAFKKYARSYRIEIIDSKDPSVQLTASKSSIKYLYKDLLDEIKGFKYQIKLKILLRKHEKYGDICSCLFEFYY